MSIPDKFYRIARGKLTELKDWFDRVDEERELQQSGHQSAREELNAAISSSQQYTPHPVSPPPSVEGINSGLRASSAPPAMTIQDPLAYHYRLLGLQPGTDLFAVEAAYKSYIKRADPSRFSSGSPEEATAKEIRQRIESAYEVLRDALDPTVRRFDLLEFDTAPKKGDNSDGTTH